MNIGYKIKNLRLEKGFTQKELAKLSSVAEITIRKYESGQSNPKIETIKKIAKALNVRLEDILGLNDTQFPLKIELPFTFDKDGNMTTTDKFNKEVKAKELFLVRSGIYDIYDKNSKLFYDWRKNYNQIIELINKQIQSSIELINSLDTKYLVFDKEYYTKLLENFLDDFSLENDQADIFIADLENIDTNNLPSFDDDLEYKKSALSDRYFSKDFTNKTEEEINLLYEYMIDEKKHK